MYLTGWFAGVHPKQPQLPAPAQLPSGEVPATNGREERRSPSVFERQLQRSEPDAARTAAAQEATTDRGAQTSAVAAAGMSLSRAEALPLF